MLIPTCPYCQGDSLKRYGHGIYCHTCKGYVFLQTSPNDSTVQSTSSQLISRIKKSVVPFLFLFTLAYLVVLINTQSAAQQTVSQSTAPLPIVTPASLEAAALAQANNERSKDEVEALATRVSELETSKTELEAKVVELETALDEADTEKQGLSAEVEQLSDFHLRVNAQKAAPREAEILPMVPLRPMSVAEPSLSAGYAAPKPTPAYSYSATPAPAAPRTYYSPVAENGSYYGEISDATGRAKTVSVSGYTRKDGTYVRGHYRSPPRR